MSFADNYGIFELDYETKDKEFFEVCLQYIEDDLDTYVHAIIISDLTPMNLPFTNPNMIDLNLQEIPQDLNIYNFDKIVMALFGLKNIQDYDHDIQYNEEA